MEEAHPSWHDSCDDVEVHTYFDADVKAFITRDVTAERVVASYGRSVDHAKCGHVNYKLFRHAGGKPYDFASVCSGSAEDGAFKEQKIKPSPEDLQLYWAERVQRGIHELVVHFRDHADDDSVVVPQKGAGLAFKECYDEMTKVSAGMPVETKPSMLCLWEVHDAQLCAEPLELWKLRELKRCVDTRLVPLLRSRARE